MKRYTIGYFGAYIADAYGTAIVEAVADVVHHCGGQLVMIADSAMLQEKDEFLKHGFAKEGVLSGLDGLIVNVRRREKSIMNQHGVGWLANFYKGPVVTIDCSWGDFPQVSHDQEQATRAAIAHMREHHGVERMGAISVYKNDLALVKDVMKSEGVLARPEHAVLCENEAGLDDAVACFRKTRSGLSVSAIIAPESISARGLVVSFQKAGVLIPQDLALICSDAPYCPEQGTPGITTTGPSYSRIAREAAEAMMLHVQQGTPLKSTRVQGRLMVRRKVHVFMEHAEGKRKSEAMPEWMSPARERTAQRIVTRRAMWGL